MEHSVDRHNQVKTPQEAYSAARQLAIFVMDHGKLETGTPESALLISLMNYLKKQPGVET